MQDFHPEPPSVAHVIHQTIMSRRESIDEVSERIMHAVETLPCAQGSLEDISLALSEALANALVHGNRENPERNVDIYATCDGPGQFRLVVTDEGEGFDPARVPDPTASANLMANHGRGLFLIRQLMDHMDLRLGGRQIVMIKARREAAGQIVSTYEKNL